jgi:predicted RNA binding protein YcfA (HicA-like mRNA interferase family)
MAACLLVPAFPAMTGRELLAVLCRKPLNYSIARQKGSHRTLKADGRPDLLFSFHDGASIAPGLVRRILLHDIGLADEEARSIIKR